jgi:hypothetical protein
MSATANPYRPAFSTNATATSFTAKSGTATKPVASFANGIHDLFTDQAQHYSVPRFIDLQPFGTAANNNTFDMQLWGWSRTYDTPTFSTSPIWIPRLLIELNVVLGNVTFTYLSATQQLADTLTIAKGDADSPIISPANDYAASILVHLRGSELIEFEFDADAGASASTGANCLWKCMDQ